MTDDVTVPPPAPSHSTGGAAPGGPVVRVLTGDDGADLAGAAWAGRWAGVWSPDVVAVHGARSATGLDPRLLVTGVPATGSAQVVDAVAGAAASLGVPAVCVPWCWAGPGPIDPHARHAAVVAVPDTAAPEVLGEAAATARAMDLELRLVRLSPRERLLDPADDEPPAPWLLDRLGAEAALLGRAVDIAHDLDPALTVSEDLRDDGVLAWLHDTERRAAITVFGLAADRAGGLGRWAAGHSAGVTMLVPLAPVVGGRPVTAPGR